MDHFRKVRVNDPASKTERDCYLVKYAPRERPTIRIGTLEYFRSMEGAQSDNLDGRVEGLRFNGPSGRMTSERFNRTMRDSSFQITARDGMEIGPTGSISDSVHRACPNVFVFCCSMEFAGIPDSVRYRHFGAGAYAVVYDPERLLSEVQWHLFSLARDNEGNRLDSERHYLKSWHAPVRYVSRQPAEVDNAVNNLDLFVFQKDPRFEIEQEYRFVWAFFDSESNQQIWVQRDAVDIPVSWTYGLAHVPVSK